ncbi:unnamed protein product, partial [Ectocarpus sp. 6 AP-2014]
MQTVEDREKAKAQEELSAPPLEATAAATAAAASDGVPRDVHRRLAIRTRSCDDFFENCAGPRAIKQIVSLGAGMDTRGLRRRASGDTKVFEVDQALVLRVKSALLTQAAAADEVAAAVAGFRERRDGGVGQGRVFPVQADLSVEGWQGELFEAGFDPSLPSAWILEGLTMYLEEEELVALLRALASLSSPGSTFCATCVSAESGERTHNSASPLMGRWKWGSDKPPAFFEGDRPTLCGPSARASRQERPSHAGGGGRRSSRGRGRISREEGRRCRPGARCPCAGRPERGRVAGGAVRGGLRPQPAERVDLGGADHV